MEVLGTEGPPAGGTVVHHGDPAGETALTEDVATERGDQPVPCNYTNVKQEPSIEARSASQ